MLNDIILLRNVYNIMCSVKLLALANYHRFVYQVCIITSDESFSLNKLKFNDINSWNINELNNSALQILLQIYLSTWWYIETRSASQPWRLHRLQEN